MFKLLRLLFKDFLSGRVRKRLYGIHMYTGLYGSGKTISMVKRLEEIRLAYPDAEIYTNFGYIHETGPLVSYDQMFHVKPVPVVYAYDEIQNDFDSRNYRDFPFELLTVLTQNRKGAGVTVLCTAQNYERVDKVIRELCMTVSHCMTILGRLNQVVTYTQPDYETWLKKSSDKKIDVRSLKRQWFVQDDELRSCYDSFKRVETIKKQHEQSTQSSTDKIVKREHIRKRS